MLTSSIMSVGYNMKYYEDNALDYIESTKDADMSELYRFFLKHLKKKEGKILDIGFGSGRDMLYFRSLGFDVYGIDPTKSFSDYVSKLGFNNIENIGAQDMNYNNEFIGIWACASLLHIDKKELKEVFEKCANALKEDGVMYCSFKYGDFECIRNGRYFLYLNEASVKEYIIKSGLKVVGSLITNDVRPGREKEKWLNIILEKE